MVNQLKNLQKEYQNLTKKLSSPELISDPKKYKTIAKRHRELEELIAKMQNFQKIEKDLTKARKMLETEKDAELTKLAEDEIDKLEKDLRQLKKEIDIALLPKDPNDDKNAIMEIRAGTGGEEAALFATDLYRMYSRYAENKGWKLDIMNSSRTGLGGLKEIILKVDGENVYGNLKYESGVHRVQRVPVTEKSGRIHTSAASVVVLPEAEEVELEIDPKDLRIDTFRASGPGGQYVQKTSSAVRITYLPTGLIVACQDERSQLKNREKAMRVLRARLFDQEQEKRRTERGEARKIQIGTGDRSEKIRTYNFPQDRVTDHRIKLTLHGLPDILGGKLDELVEKLKEENQRRLLEQME